MKLVPCRSLRDIYNAARSAPLPPGDMLPFIGTTGNAVILVEVPSPLNDIIPILYSVGDGTFAWGRFNSNIVVYKVEGVLCIPDTVDFT